MKNHTEPLDQTNFDIALGMGLPVLAETEVPSDAVEIIEARVNRLAKRAEKRGFPKPILVLGPTFPKTRTAPDGSDYTVEYRKVAILATAKLSLGGWRLLAVIAPVEKDGRTLGLATAVPGETAEYGLIENWNRCDHCNAHRNRNETFIVEHESGERKQIGRQCLRDFLGHDPSALTGWYEATSSLIDSDEIESWGSSAPRMYRPDEIIEISARVVANVGFYVSRRKAEEQGLQATGDAIWEALAPTATSYKEFVRDFPLLGTELAEATKAACRLLVESDEPATNDWVRNVRNVVSVDYVQRRHVGIVASAVILGQRLMEREAKEKVAEALKAERVASGAREPAHVGTVGQRITLPLIVEFSKTFDGQYGVTTLIKFRTAEGDLVQWWASGERDIESGERLTLTGTVKAHETDRFSKEPVTTLTRCKVD